MQTSEKVNHPLTSSRQGVSGLSGVARRLVLPRLNSLPFGWLRIEEPDGNTVHVGQRGTGPDGGVIVLNDWRTYSMMMSGGALGAAEAFMEKFGGDSMTELRRNFEGYLAYLSERGWGER